ncbi:hypothetical protein C7U60_10370 [Mesorhizobium plurifarium]|nr:hypothetical protein C7U60_10370 [Mesorhizobium plurifarium]
MLMGTELNHRPGKLTRAGQVRNQAQRAPIRGACQPWRRHAASEQAAVGRSSIAAIMLAVIVITGLGEVRADAQQVAECIELRRDRPLA